jgi:filamentous hemagglutinin family protein
MNQIRNKKSQLSFPFLLGFVSCFGLYCSALAEITPDSSLPINSTVSTQGSMKIIEGGTQKGANLFHSFKDFSFSVLTPNITGDIAYFNNDVGIQNIITRVTGGLPTNIDGIIKTNGSANLFFLNPAGIIFGQNASLDIGGSFVGSTANNIKFADGSSFSATEPEASPLLTISTPVGLQFGANPGEIINQSQASLSDAVNSLGLPVGLQVPNGKTLALVGGNIYLTGGNLTANDGRIELGSVEANSFISLSEIDKGYFLGYSGVQSFGDISFSQGANIDTSGDGGGSIQIFGKNISVADNSLIYSFTFGSNSGESIFINASNFVEVTDGSNIATLSEGEGKAGDVLVKATNSISILGTASDGSPSFIGSQVCVLSANCESVIGNGGNTALETRRLFIRDGAAINTVTFGAGNAGDILIKASDFIEVVATSADGMDSSSISTQVQGETIENSGNSGNLTIETTSLTVTDGGQISTVARLNGNGGNLNINATDSVLLTEASPLAIASSFDTSRSGLFVSAEPDATGNVGSLNLTTGTLTVEKGARISADNFGSGLPNNSTLNVGRLIIRDGGEVKSGSFASGNGGTLTVNAKKSVDILGTGNIAGESIPSTLFSQAQASGNAGNLIVNTPTLNVSNGGEVTVSAKGTGAAGNLTVNANRIRLNQGKLTAETNAGEGANIKLNDVKLLRLENQSLISAQAFNQANGGNISINAPNGFIVASQNQNNDIIANAFQGQGGKIDINARTIFNLAEGLSIPANTTNNIDASSEFGLTGEVIINTPDVDPSRGLVQLPSGLMCIVTYHYLVHFDPFPEVVFSNFGSLVNHLFSRCKFG